MRRAGTTGDLKATSSEFLIVGNVTQLASNDSVLRPMLAKNGAEMEVDADHVLEDQLGGSNTIDNMWLLDRSYESLHRHTDRASMGQTDRECADQGEG